MKSKFKLLVIMAYLAAGCRSISQNTPKTAVPLPPVELVNAEKAFAAGEFYLAKTKTGIYLKKNPNSAQAQTLMAQILSAEIAERKESFVHSAAEESSADDKKLKIKTWLEQSRSLLEMGEYDEATRSAESVFTLDPENGEASKLLDTIKKRAWEEGKKEIMDGSEVVRAEVDDRVMIYRKQITRYMSEGQWGAAKLTAEKVLLLHPEDDETLKILEQIKSKQNAAAKKMRSEVQLS